ncbi:unnamed protein product [Urochloa decumbens]|uniref:Uncharacterized protein n=1 Tax=Urochloa decumbens TaxID=240449 RepID=A0ABC9DQK7_9POAL
MSTSDLCMAEKFSNQRCDVDELVCSMMTDLISWQSLGKIDDGTKCSLIYKVLERLRVSDPNAYEPRVISIGPYHHGAASLLPMEKEKWLCLDYVLKLNYSRSLHDYLAAVTALETETRICYADDNILNSTTFVEMLLLDSCFILVCLNGIGGVRLQADVDEGYVQEQDVLDEIVVDKSSKKDKEVVLVSIHSLPCTKNGDLILQTEQIEHDSPQLTKQGNTTQASQGQSQENTEPGEQWYNSSAVYDLLLLENQIPFFVVRKIYELLVNDESTSHVLLTDNLARFIEGVLLHMPLAIQHTDRPKDFDHLLHLCYLYLKPSRRIQFNHRMKKGDGCFHNFLRWGIKYVGRDIDSEKNEQNLLSSAHFKDMLPAQQLKGWRRAEEYHEAGIEFTERVFNELQPHSLLDIDFRNGRLHIPCLPIDDKSGTLFRNLLAFEQSCPALGNDIASYVYFLSQLISVPDDVALLSRKGVIVHQLDSDEEVSTLFANLFEYVIFDFSGEHYLKSLCHTMEAHYQNRVNRWMAWLWHKYFGNPWLGFAAITSAVMVLCSVGQTILAFLSYISVS